MRVLAMITDPRVIAAILEPIDTHTALQIGPFAEFSVGTRSPHWP